MITKAETETTRAYTALPLGMPVRYWTGSREGAGRISRTRTAVQMLGDHTAVVWVEGEASCIAMTHIQPILLSAVADVVYELNPKRLSGSAANAVADSADALSVLYGNWSRDTIGDVVSAAWTLVDASVPVRHALPVSAMTALDELVEALPTRS